MKQELEIAVNPEEISPGQLIFTNQKLLSQIELQEAQLKAMRLQIFEDEKKAQSELAKSRTQGKQFKQEIKILVKEKVELRQEKRQLLQEINTSARISKEEYRNLQAQLEQFEIDLEVSRKNEVKHESELHQQNLKIIDLLNEIKKLKEQSDLSLSKLE